MKSFFDVDKNFIVKQNPLNHARPRIYKPLSID